MCDTSSRSHIFLPQMLISTRFSRICVCWHYANFSLCEHVFPNLNSLTQSAVCVCKIMLTRAMGKERMSEKVKIKICWCIIPDVPYKIHSRRNISFFQQICAFWTFINRELSAIRCWCVERFRERERVHFLNK